MPAHRPCGLRALFVGTCLLGFAETLAAQDGTIRGRIREQDGSAVYGATVLLLTDDVVIAGSDSDRLGLFTIFPVAQGRYTVRVQGLGYAEHSEDVIVGLGEAVELDLRLERSPVELEGISVQAERSRQRVRFEEVGGATIRELAQSVLKEFREREHEYDVQTKHGKTQGATFPLAGGAS